MSKIRALAEAACRIDAAMEVLQDYTIDDDVCAAAEALSGIGILLENRLRGLLAGDVFYMQKGLEDPAHMDLLGRPEDALR